jgi:pantothenate synthetase
LMVGTIVNAFEIVNPTNAYFGEKDYHYWLLKIKNTTTSTGR